MNEENKRDTENSTERSDMMTFKTPSSTYRFTPSWVENESLKDILVGLITDDLSRPQ